MAQTCGAAEVTGLPGSGHSGLPAAEGEGWTATARHKSAQSIRETRTLSTSLFVLRSFHVPNQSQGEIYMICLGKQVVGGRNQCIALSLESASAARLPKPVRKASSFSLNLAFA